MRAGDDADNSDEEERRISRAGDDVENSDEEEPRILSVHVTDAKPASEAEQLLDGLNRSSARPFCTRGRRC